MRRDHGRQHGTRAQPCSFEIDRKDLIPLGLGHLDRIGIGVAPGIIYKTRGRTETRYRLLVEGRDVRNAPDVAGGEEDALAQSRRESVTSLGVDIDHGDLCVFCEGLLDDCPPNSAASSRDDDVLLL